MSGAAGNAPRPLGAWKPPGFARFFQTEASGAVLLLLAAIAALVVANSALYESYEVLRHLPIEITVGSWHFEMDLAHLVDEFLMALFFLVIGLEIKREMIVGELSSVRRALLPIAGAVGGMVVPAVIYVAMNWGHPDALRGWGIPVATDIAFALGVLALVGRHAPTTMRVFLAALAIADDIGAILVIAVFYSSGVSLAWIIFAAVILALLYSLNRLGVDSPVPYLALGLLLWFAILNAGLHATFAGVLLAFTIPVKARVAPGDFTAWARGLIQRIEDDHDPDAHILADDLQQRQALAIERSARFTVTPLQRMEFALHPFTTFFVLPLFAFVNAGVHLPGGSAEILLSPVALGVALGLVVGKPVGIFCASWLLVRLKLADLPTGMQWSNVLVVGVLGGIGFTMSLFVTNLAFAGNDAFAAQAKLAILITSVLAGGLGALALRTLCPVCTAPDK